MKKYSIIVIVIALGLIAKDGFTWRNGAPSGRSGSLGDNSNTCASASCHTGPMVTDEELNIIIEGVNEGYTLGDTVLIAVELVKNGNQRFGFQLAAENQLGQKVGKFIPVSGSTKLAGGNITHVSSSTDEMDAKTWMFEWVAPTTEEGTVTFYLAGNFANKDGGKAGDVIGTATQEFPQAALSIAEAEKLNVQIFPMPASSHLTVNGNFNIASASIYNMSGALVAFHRDLKEKVDVSGLPVGTYVLKVESENGVSKNIISIAR